MAVTWTRVSIGGAGRTCSRSGSEGPREEDYRCDQNGSESEANAVASLRRSSCTYLMRGSVGVSFWTFSAGKVTKSEERCSLLTLCKAGASAGAGL